MQLFSPWQTPSKLGLRIWLNEKGHIHAAFLAMANSKQAWFAHLAYRKGSFYAAFYCNFSRHVKDMQASL